MAADGSAGRRSIELSLGRLTHHLVQRGAACLAAPTRQFQQEQDPASRELSFLERLGLLVDYQWTWRENQALARRLHVAKRCPRNDFPLQLTVRHCHGHKTPSAVRSRR